MTRTSIEQKMEEVIKETSYTRQSIIDTMQNSPDELKSYDMGVILFSSFFRVANTKPEFRRFCDEFLKKYLSEYACTELSHKEDPFKKYYDSIIPDITKKMIETKQYTPKEKSIVRIIRKAKQKLYQQKIVEGIISEDSFAIANPVFEYTETILRERAYIASTYLSNFLSVMLDPVINNNDENRSESIRATQMFNRGIRDTAEIFKKYEINNELTQKIYDMYTDDVKKQIGKLKIRLIPE